MKQPKTWDELLEAGYVVELSEEQIFQFKYKTGQFDRHDDNIDYWSPEEIKRREKANSDAEARMRGVLK